MIHEKSIPGGAYWCDDNCNMWSVGTHTKEDAEKAASEKSSGKKTGDERMINNKEMVKEMLLEANATISSIKSLLIKLQTHDLSDEAISLIQEAAIGIGDAYVNLHLAGRKLNG